MGHPAFSIELFTVAGNDYGGLTSRFPSGMTTRKAKTL
jgi:hypothetical protein